MKATVQTTIPHDGGQAFPSVAVYASSDPHRQGMSLRAYFAGQVLSNMRAEDWSSVSDGAKYCVDYADALIAALNEP